MCLTSRSKQIEDSRPAPTQVYAVSRPAERLTAINGLRPSACRLYISKREARSPYVAVARPVLQSRLRTPCRRMTSDRLRASGKRRFPFPARGRFAQLFTGNFAVVQISRRLSDCMKFDRRGLGAGLWRSVPSSSRNRGLLGRFAASNAAVMPI